MPLVRARPMTLPYALALWPFPMTLPYDLALRPCLTGLPCGRASGRRDVEIGDLSEEEIVAEVDKGVRAVLLKEDAPPPKVL